MTPRVRPKSPRALEYSVLFHCPAQRDDVVGDAAVECEDQAEGEFGDGHGVFTRAVRYENTAFACGGDVDRVVAGPCSDDQFQRPGFEHRFGDLRGADDQDVGLLVAHGIDQGLILQLGLV